MNSTVLLVCLVVVGAAVALPGGHGGGGGYGGPTPYNFNYGVSSGYTNFGQSESGNGYGGAQGGYWVNLPDGRTQRVSYWAGNGGFFPVVSYSGVARYPAGYGGGGGGGHGGGGGGHGGGGGGYGGGGGHHG